MPTYKVLSDEELKKIAQAGGNPAEYAGKPMLYYSDEELAAMHPKQSSGALGAGVRSAASSAIPTIAGGIGAGVGMGALEGSALGPVGTLGGGLVGALVGGYTAGKAQEAAMPEVWKEKLAEDAKEHPYATATGSIATLPLGGFSPSVGGLARSITGLSGKQALINAGVNAGIGGIQEVAGEKLRGEDLQGGRIAESALIGALFNKPNALGRSYNSINGAIGLKPGFHMDEPGLENPDYYKSLLNPEGTKTVVPSTEDKSARSLIGVYVPDVSSTSTGIPLTEGSTLKRRVPYLERTGIYPSELTSMESEGGIIPPEPVNQREIDFEKARTEEALQNGISLGSDVTRPEVRPASTESTYTATTPDEFRQEAIRRGEDLQGRQTEQRLSGEEPYRFQQEDVVGRPKTGSYEDAIAAINQAGVSPEMTQPLFEAWQSRLAKVRDIVPTQNPSLEAKGQYEPATRQIEVGSQATQDTIPHEGAHDLWASLPADFKAAYKAKVGQKVSDYNQKVDAYNAANPSDKPMRHIDEEEYFASEVGLSTVSRLLKGEGEGFKNFWNDLKAKYKTKFGQGTEQDIHRNAIIDLMNKQVAPSGVNIKSGVQEQREGEGAERTDRAGAEKAYWDMIRKPFTSGSKSQEQPISKEKAAAGFQEMRSAVKRQEGEEGLPSPEKKQYDEAQANMQKYEFGTPEFMEAWKSREEAKNKNGGMVPLKQEKNEGLELAQKYNFLWTKPALDRARDESGIAGKPVADAIQNFHPLKNEYFGRYAEPVLSVSDKVSTLDKQKVLNTLYREDEDGVSYREQLTAPQRKLYDAFRASLVRKQEEQQKAGQKVQGIDASGKRYERLPQVNPNYTPSIMRPDVMESLVERSGDYKKYQKQLTDYWVKQGATPEAASERLAAIMSAGNSGLSNQTRFGANRLTEGLGIPRELRVQDFDKMVNRYYNRVSTDRAWYDSVESKPEVMKALDEKNPDSVAHNFENVIEHIKGEPYDKGESVVKGLNRVFTSFMLGPLTNAHILGSTIFNPMQYLKSTELASTYGKALQSLSKARQETLENGYKRRDLTTIKDIWDGTGTMTQRLAALSSSVGKLNGREWSDTASKTFAQAISDEIVPRRLADARAGDAGAIKIMKQLDASWTPEKQYSPKELSNLSSTLAGFIHGAHDSRTLPEWMMHESWIKPFFSLMSWSTAQTNQWMKHVWEPATKGNLEPLLLSTLGAAVGGYAIQQLRQIISDKRTNIPSLTEIANSSKGVEGNIPLLAYNFMQMASYTGFAGLGSMAAKDLFDMAYKNIPQGSAFPLDEAVSGVSETAAHAVSAWMQTPSADAFMQIFPRAMADIIKENFQLGRIAMNWGADTGVATENQKYQFELNKQTSNLRRYKMTEGQPYEEQTEPNTNPYLNLPAKTFKRTSDLQEAAAQVPGLIQLARQRANGNPEILKQQLQGLKQTSYQSVPSPEHQPLQFARYYQYLVATQGEDKAKQIVQSYMQHTVMNRAKAALIP